MPFSPETAFTGRLLRLAARFSPPEMAFEYRPRERAARCVFAVSVPDLADPAVPLSPDEAAARLLARTDWPFPAALLSRRQVARLLGRIRAAQRTATLADLAAETDSLDAMAVAVPAQAPPPSSLPVVVAAAADAHPSTAGIACGSPAPVCTLAALAATARSSAVMDPLDQADGLAPVPVYRVSAGQRARAENRYHRRGDEYVQGLMDMRLSASGGPTLLRLAPDQLGDEADELDDDALDLKLETMTVSGGEDEREDLFV